MTGRTQRGSFTEVSGSIAVYLIFAGPKEAFDLYWS